MDGRFIANRYFHKITTSWFDCLKLPFCVSTPLGVRLFPEAESQGTCQEICYNLKSAFTCIGKRNGDMETID